MSDSKELIKIKEEPEDWKSHDVKVEVKVEACDHSHQSGNIRFKNRLGSIIDVKEEDLPGPEAPMNQITENIQELNIDQSLQRQRRKAIQKTCSCCSGFDNDLNKKPHHNSKVVKALKRQRQVPPEPPGTKKDGPSKLMETNLKPVSREQWQEVDKLIDASIKKTAMRKKIQKKRIPPTNPPLPSVRRVQPIEPPVKTVEKPIYKPPVVQDHRLLPRLFKCDYCGRSYLRKAHLKRHVIVHIARRSHRCATCYKCSARSDILNKHQLLHEEGIRSKCETCGIFVKNLGAHMLRHRSLPFNFECLVCLKRFKTKFNLEQHRWTHSTMRRFTCHLCEKSFKTDDSLRHHVKIHSATREFKCDLCEVRAFKRKDHLKQHRLIIHLLID